MKQRALFASQIAKRDGFVKTSEAFLAIAKSLDREVQCDSKDAEIENNPKQEKNEN